MQNDIQALKWEANWIWQKDQQETVNFYMFARKEFELNSLIKKAEVHISAYSEYILFINGVYIGRGPHPYVPKYQYYDTYQVEQYLHPGKNVIAVLAHNYAVGLHWQPMSPGGLILQAQIETENEECTLVSDETWKVKNAEGYALNSPRMMFACQFVETFDFNRYDEQWKEVDYLAFDWENAYVIGRPPQYPWEKLIPPEIPRLIEKLVYPTSIQKGNFEVIGCHTVSFKDIIPAGENHIGFAQTYLFSENERKLLINISCDDAFKVFLNDELVGEQIYSESFVRESTWNLRENYEQFHCALGIRTDGVLVNLKKEWNKLCVVVDQGPAGWGFALGFSDNYKGTPGFYHSFCINNFVDMPFTSSIHAHTSTWLLSGPFASTGLKNSLNHIMEQLDNGQRNLQYHSQKHLDITDCSMLMQAEEKNSLHFINISETISLNEGECLIVDLGVVRAGFPIFELESDGEAILDSGYGNVLPTNKKMSFMWQMRYVDRLYLKAGLQSWQCNTRREGRYIYISCRKGKNVNFKKLQFISIGYPLEKHASFECSDNILNNVWKASVYTSEILMQDSYQDCMKRECGVHNTRSFIHSSMAALNCFGDSKLIRKNILEGIRLQDETGWFNSHGPTDNNADEPTQCLWWFELLKNYLLYTGDLTLIEENYEKIKGVLRYFSRIENMALLLDCKNENKEVRNRYVYIDDNMLKPPHIGLYDGVLFAYNVLYYGALKNAGFIAEKLGHAKDSEFYNKKACFVKESCNLLFWNEEEGHFMDWTREGVRSDNGAISTNIAALYFDVCNEKNKDRLIEYLFEEMGAREGKFENYEMTFGFYYFLLETFYRHEYDNTATQLLKEYFGKWLALGATTFGEHFSLLKHQDLDNIEEEYNTHNYATSSHIHFYRNILGVQPTEKGFSKLVFRPRPGGLLWAKGKIFTPMGEVFVSWKADNNVFELEITLPTECVYTLDLPAAFNSYKVQINNEKIVYGGI